MISVRTTFFFPPHMDLTVNQDSHVREVKLLFGNTFPHVVRPVLAFRNLQKLSRGQRRDSGKALLGLLASSLFGVRALSVAVHAWDLLKKVTTIFITSTTTV